MKMREEYFDSAYGKRKGVGAVAFVLTIIIVMLVSVFASYLYFDKHLGNSAEVPTSTPEPTPTPGNTTVITTDAKDTERAFVSIYEENCESVVKITVYATVNGTKQKYSSASGFITSTDGYIYTNNHVLTNAEDIEVTLYSGKTCTAKEIGRDDRTEVAVIKIEPEEKLKPVKLGDSNSLKVGQYAIAIGNPLGYEFSMSVGTVSGLHRMVDSSNYRYEMIQIDTPINSGNSGGPLFNLNGEVIGINTLKEVTAGTNATVEGMGFAIPINIVKNIAEQLISNGKVSRAAINATVGNKIENNTYAGVYIAELTPGGAAEQAGLKVNDVIVSFNGQKITVMNDIMEQLEKCAPGDKVQIVFKRDGKEMSAYITLGIT